MRRDIFGTQRPQRMQRAQRTLRAHVDRSWKQQKFFAVLAIFATLALSSSAAAQQQPPPQQPPPEQQHQQSPPPAAGTTTGVDLVNSMRQELTDNQKTQHYIGSVELVSGDLTVYADEVWQYSDTHKFVATGNIVFSQGNNRISAEQAEFDTETHTGIFYTAWGVAPRSEEHT